jgi:hypothetical protein
MTNHLYDADDVERLAVKYGRPNTSERKDRIEEQIIEETIGAIYPDEIPDDPRFFSAVPLLVALIKLHRETDDSELLEHIKREIEVVRGTGRTPIVADFDLKPFPYASHSDLLAVADRYENRDESMSRYFRLRAFQAIGAFDVVELPEVRGDGLTDDERDYLEGIRQATMDADTFPSGSALISALIDLHRETEDEEMIDLIESEIDTEGLGLVSVAIPDEKALPDASVEELLDVHDNFERRDKAVGRYLRLRIFETLGAFEEYQNDRGNDSEDVVAGLTDDELRYLQSIDGLHIRQMVDPELERRGIEPED